MSLGELKMFVIHFSLSQENLFLNCKTELTKEYLIFVFSLSVSSKDQPSERTRSVHSVVVYVLSN